MVAIAKGVLVRFTTKVTRFVRDLDFSSTNKSREVPAGTVGICLGHTEGAWGSAGTRVMRPVIFTALGFRICEHPENLEVLSGPPSEVPCQL